MNNERVHKIKLPSGKIVECAHGANLRAALSQDFSELYHPVARWIHCRGLGTCGTCAVQVSGELSPTTAIESWRLSFPPHHAGSGLRLACQACVEGDLEIKKFGGLWGHEP